jgi:transposase
MEKAGRKSGRRYTEEFKRRTLALVRTSGKSQAAISRDLGIPKCTLVGWVVRERETEMPKAGAKAGKAKTPLEELEEENARLTKANRVLQMERDILKKAAAFFAKESE